MNVDNTKDIKQSAIELDYNNINLDMNYVIFNLENNSYLAKDLENTHHLNSNWNNNFILRFKYKHEAIKYLNKHKYEIFKNTRCFYWTTREYIKFNCSENKHLIGPDANINIT